MQNIAIGVDIGGSHITCQQVDLDTNRPLNDSLFRTPVDNGAGKEEILENWAAAIHKTAGETGISALAGVGFAMPGPFDYQKGIAWFDKNVKKFGSLNGVHVQNELRKLLNVPQNFPLRFLNDAASFAVGEASLGKSSVYKKIIALTLGTGFGTTFIDGKLPVTGRDGVPDDGFLYHIPYKNSIADDYFSTRWFVDEYRNLTGNEIPGVKDLAEKAGTDPLVCSIFRNFGSSLGSFIRPWIERFECECIVIGGNISNCIDLFKPSMAQELKESGVQVMRSSLDEQAAIIGSARLCDHHFYSKLRL